MVTALTVILVAAGGIAVVQNDYDNKEERVSIPFGDSALDGVLATPSSGDRPVGLVVFVPGDGPIDATYDGFHRPMWESFARAGHASLSWTKPGVNRSSGNWLNQSMQDRADEVAAVISWASQRPDFDLHRIGLWGSSQAGWVMPKVARQDPSLCFMIAVSPAINWREQDRSTTLAQLHAEGASETDIDHAINMGELRQRLLQEGATFEQHTAAVNGNVGAMTADRWAFISKNFRSDATGDLAESGLRVLLILAGHNLNVDVADTRAVYERVLPNGQLEVRFYPDATHGVVQKDIEDSTLWTNATAIFNPRGLFAPQYLTDMQAFLEQSTQDCPPTPAPG